MENRGLRLLFWAILLVYLLTGILYVVVTPAWQNPDEPAHYNYIRALAGHGAFPELVAGCYNQEYLSTLISEKFPDTLSIDGVCYEFHQPPLYYTLLVPVFLATDGYLPLLRTVSLLFGAVTVVLAYYIGRTIYPTRPDVAIGAMVLTAFVPMHTAILASVNNDGLAGAILAAILLLLVRRLSLPATPTIIDDLLLGLLLGLALITKTTVYIAVPLSGITLLYLSFFRRQALFRPLLVVFGPALFIALPWYIRNAALYGGFDILGLQRHDVVVVGQLRSSEFIADIGHSQYLGNYLTTTFQSFWGQFGWMAVPMDQRTYRFLLLVMLVAGAGLLTYVATGWRSVISSIEKQMLSLLILSALLTITAYVWYNLSFVQFQGRYLFSAIIPFSILAAVGLSEAIHVRWQIWFTAGLLVVAGLVGLGEAAWIGGLL
jgi:4-amino-4-deoxy-L-arabinose transferase-like glycosyltransferase